MTLEEAIKRLAYSREHNTILITGDDKAALTLSIEAMKREKGNRENPDFVVVGPLPGETKGDKNGRT